ncbi:hypothetical protein TRIUR3_15814 [Triticum urartu]|uniref:Uncharacterized protein n=1 Tax=Triticum urartu TaxID=4572 RepID=M7ZMU0_TRIUA|nr:hypothetical protein TRIUR3_15814 [Triticum urartu]
MATELEKQDGDQGETSSPSARVRLLEREVAVAKQTEARMLESLIHRTKELEQAKGGVFVNEGSSKYDR